MSASPSPSPSPPAGDPAAAPPPAAALSNKPVVLEPARAVVAVFGLLALAGVALLLFKRGSEPWRDLSQLPFPLEPCLVPRETLVAPARPDAFPALDEPRLLGADEAAGFKIGQGKFLVPGDRVIGTVVEGEACAFPVRILEWHETLDTTLGGVPIVVTWAALSECARVFDRRVGGETLAFHPSGVLSSMNALLYERRGRGEPSSLWSQVDGRAVTGPLAARGAVLRPIPAELLPWGAWKAAHPTTRVLAPDLRVGKLYKRNPYATYMGSDSLPFPVAPLPPAGLALKARVLAVEAGGERRVYAVERVSRRADRSGAWETTQGEVRLRFEVHADPGGVQPETLRVSRLDGQPLLSVPALWFAWHAAHPQDPLVD